MQKIRAFTLLELLIGMIISSIVIGFCYMSYSIIYKQYMSYKILKLEIVETIQFNSILNADFISAETILFDENILILNSTNRSQLQYDFNDNNILRKDGEVTDTFKLFPTNILPQYLIESEQSISSIVNDFSFDSNVLGEPEHFHFTKNYSAETMINNFAQQNK